MTKSGEKSAGMNRLTTITTSTVAPKVVPICTTEKFARARVKDSPHKIHIKPSRPPATKLNI